MGASSRKRGEALIGGPILIVDDDPMVREPIATTLELHGFRTQAVGDGREALAAMAAERPAIILLDLHLPILDGAGLLRELAARGVQVPVVLMSADVEAERVASQFGIGAFLRKPIALPRLLAAIAACRPRPARGDPRRSAA
jgi:two-component system response regulator MprA